MVEEARKVLDKKLKSVQELEQLRQAIIDNRNDTSRITISVCGGTGCRASGAEAVVDAFEEEIEKQELQVKVEFKETGCHGFCERGPLVVIGPEKIFLPAASNRRMFRKLSPRPSSTARSSSGCSISTRPPARKLPTSRMYRSIKDRPALS